MAGQQPQVARHAREVHRHLLGEKALGLFREAHDLAREVGEQNHIASVLNNMGEALLRLERIDESVKTLRDAETLCDETGDKLIRAVAA